MKKDWVAIILVAAFFAVLGFATAIVIMTQVLRHVH